MANTKTAASKLIPIGGNILVQGLEHETVTISGIVLPETVSKEKPQRGKIIALGTGRRDDKGDIVPFNVKVGDTVIFKKYGPDEVEVDNQDYLIMEESDILAILT